MLARRGGRRNRLCTGVVLALVVMVTVVTTPVASASYYSSTNSSADFSAAGCFHRANVQKGTATSTAEGTTSVSIGAVDPTKAFLVFTSRHSSNRPVGSEIGGRLASATAIEFIRVSDESAPVTMTIEWSVIEYPCGVNVQRGSVFQNATAIDWPITPVASVAQAFVLWSKTTDRTDVIYSDNDPVLGELTTVSNLQFRVNGAAASHVIYWQVVEFTDPTTIAVQHGSTSLVGTATSTAVALASPTAPARSFVLVGGRSTPVGNDVGSGLVRATLAGPSSLTLDRGATNYDITEIGWQVIELRDGSSVQSGSASFPTGVGAVVASIAAVPLARSTAFASGQTGGGENGGRTTYVGDDIIGVAAAGMRLTTPTQLTLTRDNTAGDADIAWSVVSWGWP